VTDIDNPISYHTLAINYKTVFSYP
jgi:hypothetical protein